jgi:hypothetical protein
VKYLAVLLIVVCAGCSPTLQSTPRYPAGDGPLRDADGQVIVIEEKV